MIPTKLRLKGFIGIKSGLGRDELVLDLATLTDGAQLVALVGPNGMGKSTILDNLHPFRLMPSRAGSYSPGSFSYYDNVYGTEALKELEFHHDGQHYRSTLVFKMGGKTKKTECYLHILQPDGTWMPVTLPDGTRADGKTETYDRCIDHIVGTPEMFFTSAFAAQNRRSLSSYTNGEIKGLLSELLGLEHISALGKNAGEVAKILRVRMDGMRDELNEIDTLEAERATTEQQLDDDKTELDIKMQARQIARNSVGAAQKNLADAKAGVGASIEVEARRSALQGQIATATQRRDVALADVDKDIKAETARAAETAFALRREALQLKDKIPTYQQQIARAEALIQKKDAISEARAALTNLEADEAAAIPAVEAARRNAEKHRSLISERNTLKARLDAAASEGKSLTVACEGLKARAGLVDRVPCQGSELQPRCELLKEAMAARGGIPKAEEQAAAKRAEYAEIQARGKEIDTALDLMGDAEAELIAAERRQQEIIGQMREAAALANQATALAQAEATIAHANEQLAEIDNLVAAKEQQATDVEVTMSERLVELQARKDQIAASATTEIAALNAELAALPPPADTTAVVKAEVALQNAEVALATADQNYERLTVRIATHQERLRTIENRLREAGTTRARASTIESEIAHWTTLAKALGNDGIIALSIDDAGPTLSSLANELLLSCYGHRFSVRLVTQGETATGNLKETFDIKVFDADRDEEKSVRDMSGGERIYINDVLTRAIALYQSQLSGRRYECLFSDESDGALDPDRKLQFMKVKREVLRLGNYSKEIYISHSKEVQECADAAINMEDFRC